MTENAAAQELTPEQVKALGEMNQMASTLTKSLKKMKEACQFSLADAKGPRAFVGDKLAEVKQLQVALEKKKGTPEYTYARQTLVIMEKMFDGSKRMMEVQNQYDEKNLALATQGLELVEAAGTDPNAWVKLQEDGLLDGVKFVLPLEDVRYLEARAQMNLYFALHHWLACVDGIDAVMRATVSDKAIDAQDAAEEAGRAKIADVVREAMAGDRELAVMLTQLGGEFQETYAFFEWASRNLKGLEGKPAEAKKTVLADGDWQKLNGKAVMLANLLPRLQPYPAVAQFFPAPQMPELPFEQLEWKDAPTAPPTGTGRLGTGRLQGTGRLSGQTGRLSQ